MLNHQHGTNVKQRKDRDSNIIIKIKEKRKPIVLEIDLIDCEI